MSPYYAPPQEIVLYNSQVQFYSQCDSHSRYKQFAGRLSFSFAGQQVSSVGTQSRSCTNTNPTRNLGPLAHELTVLQSHSIAASSRRTYKQGITAYAAFCRNYSLVPYPLNEDTLRLFATFLARSLSYASIQTYLAAIRHNHIELGHKSIFSSMDRLRLLVRAIKRVKGQSALPKRAPITMDLMRLLKNNLCRSDRHESDKLMLWAAFTTAFFGFLRSSEFCSQKSRAYDPDVTLLVKDVSITDSRAFINIKISKTDPFVKDRLFN